MFNAEVKEKAIELCQKALNQYNRTVEDVQQNADKLFRLRYSAGELVVKPVESYINGLANSPKEFSKSFSELELEYKNFRQLISSFEEESKQAMLEGGAGAGTGLMAATGIAALGPTALMAIATTFGTASTGTAIATLSGAAATKAALAWLGGGALAAGGGGAVAGNALLALAGPIGWTIGGAAILGAGWYYSNENAAIAEKATKQTKEIELETARLAVQNSLITSIVERTTSHSDGVTKILLSLKTHAPSDYSKFTAEQKSELAAVINNMRSFAKLLNEKI